MIEGPRSMRPLHAPKAHFDESIALIESGELAAAEGRIRSRLADYPRDVNLQALLGALLIKRNRLDEAAVLLRQVIAEAPSFAKPHEDLGHLLIQQGHADDAVPFSSVRRIWIRRSRARGSRSARRSPCRVAVPTPIRPSSAASRCRRSDA
jgi:hypothetical protein